MTPSTSGSPTWSVPGSTPTRQMAATMTPSPGGCWAGVPHPPAAGPRRTSGFRTGARSSDPTRSPRTMTPWWWVQGRVGVSRRGRLARSGRSVLLVERGDYPDTDHWLERSPSQRPYRQRTGPPDAALVGGQPAHPVSWVRTRSSCRPGTRATAATPTPSAAAPGCTARRPGGSCPRTSRWRQPMEYRRQRAGRLADQLRRPGAVLHPGRVRDRRLRLRGTPRRMRPGDPGRIPWRRWRSPSPPAGCSGRRGASGGPPCRCRSRSTPRRYARSGRVRPMPAVRRLQPAPSRPRTAQRTPCSHRRRRRATSASCSATRAAADPHRPHRPGHRRRSHRRHRRLPLAAPVGAEDVVVAAGAIESARLLLNSRQRPESPTVSATATTRSGATCKGTSTAAPSGSSTTRSTTSWDRDRRSPPTSSGTATTAWSAAA